MSERHIPTGGLVYAPWRRRVAAFLLDFAPNLLGCFLFLLGYVFFLVDLIEAAEAQHTVHGSPDLRTLTIGLLVLLAGLCWQVYNRWITAGRTGQSMGKRLLNISLLSEDTDQPIGPRNAFLRDLVHTVDGFVGLGYLWPLWDRKRQTFADMLMGTVVVHAKVRAP